MRVLISPHPHQSLLSDFFVTAFLVGVKWHSRMVLVCISLINDVKHPFKCLLTTCVSLEKCLFQVCPFGLLQQNTAAWVAYNNRDLLLIVLGKAHFLVYNWCLLTVSSHCGRLGISLELLLECTNLIQFNWYNLSIFQRPNFWIHYIRH